MEYQENALTAQDVAEMLHISKNTVYSMAKAGTLSSYKVGRKLRFTVDDVQGYIMGSKQGAGGTTRIVQVPWHEHTINQWVPPVSGVGRRAFRSDTDTFLLGGSDSFLDGLSTCLSESGIHVLRTYQNSYQALVDLYFGYIDAAAVSLWDSSSDTYNLPYIKRLLPGTPVKVFRLATFTQGFLVRYGNPLMLRKWSDILHADVVLANREKGSAARVLLDERMRLLEADPKTISGYDREIASPLVQGALIAKGEADIGIGVEKVYHQVKGIDYLPLQTEQLVLVVTKRPGARKTAGYLPSCLKSDALKQGVSGLVGYTFDSIGECIYET